MAELRPVQLPWDDPEGRQRLISIVLALLLVFAVLGGIIPLLEVPESDRKTLEQLPPQLARVIERKQLEQPKPIPEPVVIERREEVPVPPKVEEPKPQAEPVRPRPEPKPESQPKVQATEQQRQQAQERVRQSFGNEALTALQATRGQIPIAALSTSSQGLSNAGQQATEVGSVINREAATRTSGGVDSSQLTVATVGETLTEREVTAVAMTAEQQAQSVASNKRSQEELRLVFEQYKAEYDPIYRAALRRNPTLRGAATLKLEVAPSGAVTQCDVIRSELNDEGLHRRLAMKCRQMNFGAAAVEVAQVEFPMRFMP